MPEQAESSAAPSAITALMYRSTSACGEVRTTHVRSARPGSQGLCHSRARLAPGVIQVDLGFSAGIRLDVHDKGEIRLLLLFALQIGHGLGDVYRRLRRGNFGVRLILDQIVRVARRHPPRRSARRDPY